MATNFGFGSLTGVSWDILKQYDIRGNKDGTPDGKLDAVEYNNMLKDLDPDGFNGISTFGSIDGGFDGKRDGKISEEEFKIMEQKVAMAGTLDAKFEEKGAAITPDCRNAAISYLKSYAATYLAAHPDSADIEGMSGQFASDLDTFLGNYQKGLDSIDEMKKNESLGQDFYDAVKDANTNGYINAAERTKINDAAADYALQQILLKGDYSVLTDLGVSSKNVSAIKTLVANLTKSGNVQANLDALTTKITYLISNCDESKIIDKANKIPEVIAAQEATKKAAEEAKNKKSVDVYTVKPTDLQYTNLPGYADNTTLTSRNNIGVLKDNASMKIELLRQQITDKVKANCAAKGLNFDQALVDNIFDLAKTTTIDSCIKSEDKVASRFLGFLWPTSWLTDYSCNVKTLIDTFVDKFDKMMTTEINKLNAAQADANHVPTFDNITSSYLDKDGTDLDANQKEMQKIQKGFLTNPDAKIETKDVTTTTKDSNGNNVTTTTKGPDYDKAAAILDIVGADVKTQMLKAGVNETVITKLIGEAKNEIKNKLTINTKKIDMVKDFIALIQKKCEDYKTTNAPLF